MGGGGGGGGGDVGGPPMVQCNGRGSCERRSPLFPTPGATHNPASACQGRVTLLIYTQRPWTRTMQTHSSFGLCMHTARHTLVCTQRVDGLRQRQRLGGGATVAVISVIYAPSFLSWKLRKSNKTAPSRVFLGAATLQNYVTLETCCLTNPHCKSSQKPCRTISNNQQGCL